MGSISIRKRKDGSSSYLARVRVMREGTSYHETKTFDRCPAVTAWIKRREKELTKPGALEKLNVSGPQLSKTIERYTEETLKDIGRTKAQVLRTIATYPIADLPCSTIKSKDIIEFLQSLPGQPQTVGNYASHLASIFAIARPMWDFRLDDRAMRDAITVARRMGALARRMGALRSAIHFQPGETCRSMTCAAIQNDKGRFRANAHTGPLRCGGDHRHSPL